MTKIVQHASEIKDITEKENFYRTNVDKSSVTKTIIMDSSEESGDFVLLQNIGSSDAFEAGNEEFEEEDTVTHGKLVLYLTEKQIAQILKQRAVLLTKGKRVYKLASGDG